MPVETNNQMKSPRRRQFGGGLLILFTLLLLLNFVVPSFFGQRTPQIAYSDFVAQVQAGKVSQALITPDRIEFTLKSDGTTNGDATPAQTPKVYSTTPLPVDLDLPKILRDNGVEFGAPPPSNNGWIGTLLSWVAPPLIFFGIWAFLMNRQGGGQAALTVGKSKARIYSEGSTGVKFPDVAGVDEAKAELQEIVDFLKNADKYTRLGAKIPKGVLLVGPPGTGKTLLAKAIASQARANFIAVNGPELLSRWVGAAEQAVRELFAKARQASPCVVFIDEIDTLAPARGRFQGDSGVSDRVVGQLLTELDGLQGCPNVLLVGATNRPDALDPALLRAGRLDLQLKIDLPDVNSRLAILQVHNNNRPLADVNLTDWAAQTEGWNGADLALLSNQAALEAVRRYRSQAIAPTAIQITNADFEVAYQLLMSQRTTDIA